MFPLRLFLVDINADPSVLLQIQREVLGESKEDNYEDSESDEEPDEKEEQRVVRNQSRTLRLWIEKYHHCEDRNTDFSCLKRFVQVNVSDLDMGTASTYDFKKLTTYITLLQNVLMHVNRSTSFSFRNSFTDVNNIMRAHIHIVFKGYPDLVEKISDIYYTHNRANKDVVKLQMRMKADRLMYRVSHQYELDYDSFILKIRQYGTLMNVEQQNLSHADVTRLLICVVANTGARKGAVIDPSIKFHTLIDYNEKVLKLPQGGDLILGGDDGINVGTVHTFKTRAIMVQVGVLKDTAQRTDKFTGEFSDGRIVRKPCLVHSASEVIDMVTKIRKFFNLSERSRPQGVGARRKMSSNIQSRVVQKIIRDDWALQYRHAKKFGFNISTHFYRAAYACCIYELYNDQIYTASKKRYSKSAIMAKMLSHQGSFHTSLSYDIVNVSFPLPTSALYQTDTQMLKTLILKVQELEADVKNLREGGPRVEIRERNNDVVELKDNSSTLHRIEKHVKTKYRDTNHRDEVLNQKVNELAGLDIVASTANLVRCGWGEKTIAQWRHRRAVGEARNLRPVEQPPRELQEKPVLAVPEGVKVIANVNLDATENTKRQRVTRAVAQFGRENVLDNKTDCPNSPKRMKIGKALRDVCVEER